MNNHIRIKWWLSLLWTAKLYRAVHSSYSHWTLSSVKALAKSYEVWEYFYKETSQYIMPNGWYSMPNCFDWVRFNNYLIIPERYASK